MVGRNNIFQKINDFFLWLSVTDPDIIQRSECLKRERIIQSIKGQIIFIVSLFATLSGANAVYIVSQSIITSILIGVLWGYFILSVDRLLSAPFKKWNYVEGLDGVIHNFIKPILIRLPLALLLGILISIPILLKIFNPEIEKFWIESNIPNSELSDDRTRNDLVRKKESLQANYKEISFEIDELNKLINNAPILTTTIKDSSTTKINASPIFVKARTEQLNVLQGQKITLLAKINQATDSVNAFIPKSRDEISEQLKEKYLSVSLGERYENLRTVISQPKHKNLWWIHFWLQTVIILIELMPVLMKVFSDISNYDLLVEENFHKTIERIHEKSQNN